MSGLRLRKWYTASERVLIVLTGRPDDADMPALNEAVRAFSGALERREDKAPPQLSEHKSELPEETVGLGEARRRVEACVADREAAGRKDAQHISSGSRRSVDELFAEDMETATVRGVRCADLRLILSALPVGGKDHD